MKFDTTQIENFDSMSPDEKVAALLGVELPDVDELQKELKNNKDLLSKRNSEIATLKKGKDEKLNQAEEEARGYKTQIDDLTEKYNAIMRESSVNKFKAKYIALGYSEELASATAEALADGDMDTVLANGETYKAEFEKTIKANALKETPHPEGKGSGTKTTTKAEIMKIKDAAERQKAIAENIELFQ